VQEKATRRLAAILAADVAGYTRLMETDERATLTAWWQARKDIIDPSIAEHGGRIVKHTGDGFLAEFTTATAAVGCAVAMQTALAQGNEGVPRDRRFDFRMGINVGEIVVDQEDIYGDGVNIAARLESLAEAGGICLSAVAYAQVKSTLDFEYEYLGAKKVKHVAEPLRHYRVKLAGEAARSRRGAQAMKRLSPLRGALKPSRLAGAALVIIVIAGVWLSSEGPPASRLGAVPIVSVAPFRTIGEPGARDEFGDGLTEDLVTALSSMSGLRVISEDPASDEPTDRRSALASYYFEGSVRWFGDKVRVSTQLVDARTGVHLWGARYDRVLVDVLDTQIEVATKIVSTLSDRLARAELERLATQTTAMGTVQRIVYRGLENLGRIAEAAAFLPRDLTDWMTGAQQPDSTVEGMGNREARRLARYGLERWT
jgi:class 3 adenylate cyclase/TolB-like protein